MALKFTDTDTDNRVFLYRRGRLTTVLGAVMLLALSACGGSSGSGTASLAPNASLVAYKVLDIMPKASGALDVTTSMRYLALGAPGLADPVIEATTLFKLVANLFGATPKDPHCNYTGTMNGTSAAAPTVSGIVALMLEANPQLQLARRRLHCAAGPAAAAVSCQRVSRRQAGRRLHHQNHLHQARGRGGGQARFFIGRDFF